MKACLAGPHAQARYQPRKTKRIPNDWASDFKLAKSFATKAVLIRNGRGADIPIGEGTFEIVLGADDLAEITRLFHRIWNETEALVAKLWPAITLVAEELLTRRTLFEDEVDALIEGKRLTGARQFDDCLGTGTGHGSARSEAQKFILIFRAPNQAIEGAVCIENLVRIISRANCLTSGCNVCGPELRPGRFGRAIQVEETA